MMKQRNLLLTFQLSALMLIITSSCTPGSCFEETNACVKAYFYGSGGKVLPPDSLTVYGMNRSSYKIYNKALKQQPALFPLDASSGISSFIVRINGITDTVRFTFTSYPHIISKECGYTFYHSIDTPVYSKHKIKTITVRKSTITTLSEENIRIYY